MVSITPTSLPDHHLNCRIHSLGQVSMSCKYICYIRTVVQDHYRANGADRAARNDIRQKVANYLKADSA